MKIFIGTDHAGFELKETLVSFLRELGHDVEDLGAHTFEALDDYPDFIRPVAEAVARDTEARGIILGGSGQGEAMCANRVKGVRAAVYYGGAVDIVVLSREHNNANILCLGSRTINKETTIKCVQAWLSSLFEGGKHERRIGRIEE